MLCLSLLLGVAVVVARRVDVPDEDLDIVSPDDQRRHPLFPTSLTQSAEADSKTPRGQLSDVPSGKGLFEAVSRHGSRLPPWCSLWARPHPLPTYGGLTLHRHSGSLSLCSSTPVIVSMEECAFASAAYLLRSSPRDVHGTEQRWKLSLTAGTCRVSAKRRIPLQSEPVYGCSYWRMGGTVEPSLRTGAASRRCSWGSPGTRRP